MDQQPQEAQQPLQLPDPGDQSPLAFTVSGAILLNSGQVDAAQLFFRDALIVVGQARRLLESLNLLTGDMENARDFRESKSQ